MLIVSDSSICWAQPRLQPAASLTPQRSGVPLVATARQGATPATLVPVNAASAAAVLRQNPAAAQTLQLPSVYAPTRPRVAAPAYPWKGNIVTTVFWIGEGATPVSAAVNYHSSWDPHWQNNYGGFDDPDPKNRTWDFRPKKFEPQQNPFYVALPFNDYCHKTVAEAVIPWYKTHPNRGKGTVCKGQWLAIRFGKKICYAQWEDCGPFCTDDWGYVFGNKPQPKANVNNSAGLDVSPAVRDFLGIASGVRCDWRFCDASEVPDGPWRKFGDNNSFAKFKKQELAARVTHIQDLERKRQEWLKNSYDPRLAF
ncbi:MAG: hypothetical protein ACR2OZ_17780 [Verrucomicrobiales bacterium]